jgi:hypothetical protein
MSTIDWASCPEATHFDPVDQNFLREIDSALLIYNNKMGWKIPIYTQYGLSIEECKRPLLRRPEWTGEGLPPVGTVCLLAGETLTLKPIHPDWAGAEVKVYAHFETDQGRKLAAYVSEDHMKGGVGVAELFRPIRTAKQIAAEEREKAIFKIVDDSMGRCDVQGAAYLYDAGYSQQVQP